MEVETKPSNEETTMLNTTHKIVEHKTGVLNLAEELGKPGVFVSPSGA